MLVLSDCHGTFGGISLWFWGGYGGLGRGVEERNVEATSAKTSVCDHTAGTGLERVRIPPYGGSSRRSTISMEGSFVISILLSFKTPCQFESMFSFVDAHCHCIRDWWCKMSNTENNSSFWCDLWVYCDFLHILRTVGIFTVKSAIFSKPNRIIAVPEHWVSSAIMPTQLCMLSIHPYTIPCSLMRHGCMLSEVPSQTRSAGSKREEVWNVQAYVMCALPWLCSWQVKFRWRGERETSTPQVTFCRPDPYPSLPKRLHRGHNNWTGEMFPAIVRICLRGSKWMMTNICMVKILNT